MPEVRTVRQLTTPSCRTNLNLVSVRFRGHPPAAGTASMSFLISTELFVAFLNYIETCRHCSGMVLQIHASDGSRDGR